MHFQHKNLIGSGTNVVCSQGSHDPFSKQPYYSIKNSFSNIRHINLIPLSTEFNFSVNLDSNLYPLYSNFAKSIFINIHSGKLDFLIFDTKSQKK